MESQEETKSGITAMIPEVYYDLIARVPAGCLLVVFALDILLRAHGRSIPQISTWLNANSVPAVIFVSLLMSIGGLVGILISPVASMLRRLYWKEAWIAVTEKGPCKKSSHALNKLGYTSIQGGVAWSTLKNSDLDGIDRWVYDYLQRELALARTILPKLRAEADLCSYLAAAFFLLPLLHLTLYFLSRLSQWSPANLQELAFHPATIVWYITSWLTAGLLCISGSYRTKRLILRMLSMLAIISEGISPMSSNHPNPMHEDEADILYE